jgi:hypothetical protein
MVKANVQWTREDVADALSTEGISERLTNALRIWQFACSRELPLSQKRAGESSHQPR